MEEDGYHSGLGKHPSPVLLVELFLLTTVSFEVVYAHIKASYADRFCIFVAYERQLTQFGLLCLRRLDFV